MELTDDQKKVVAALKRRIGATDLTDEDLYEIYEGAKENLDCAAAEVWAQKAGAAGDLVDMVEGSSNRKLSQASSQAKENALFYRSLCEAEGGVIDPTNRPTTVRPIVRP